MTTKYLPSENAQLTRLHSGIHDRVGDELIRLQDATAELYQNQIDRLLDALATLVAGMESVGCTGLALSNATALLEEFRP